MGAFRNRGVEVKSYISDPAVIRALQEIEERDGVLRPEAVVQAAEPKTSVLHGFFEWDDSEAAELYRLHQARVLISIVVKSVPVNDEVRKVRVFVSLTPDRNEEGGGYRSVASVLSSAEMRKQLMEDALDELRVFEEKYRGLQELATVFLAIKAVRLALGS